MTINTTAVEVLGQGTASPGDGGLLNTLRDISAHLKSGDATSLRGGDITALDTNVNKLLTVEARNGAQSNRLDSANSRLDDINLAVTKQLSDTEDADISQTLIDFNSQSAAYQAALRVGANIVQTSLMDFLH
jgi:flagellar hook-associated protein 3 FlgL